MVRLQGVQDGPRPATRAGGTGLLRIGGEGGAVVRLGGRANCGTLGVPVATLAWVEAIVGL